LPEADDLLVIAKEQSAKFFEIADASADALPSPVGRQSGIIAVTSDPGGADIWVDDSFTGQTPAKLVLAPGKHRIRVSLQGYEEWTRDTEVGDGSEATLNIRLTKQTP
jgi:hypothetical protein